MCSEIWVGGGIYESNSWWTAVKNDLMGWCMLLIVGLSKFVLKQVSPDCITNIDPTVVRALRIWQSTISWVSHPQFCSPRRAMGGTSTNIPAMWIFFYGLLLHLLYICLWRTHETFGYCISCFLHCLISWEACCYPWNDSFCTSPVLVLWLVYGAMAWTNLTTLIIYHESTKTQLDQVRLQGGDRWGPLVVRWLRLAI